MWRLVLLLLPLLGALPARADVPPILVPARPESVGTSSPEAPMLVPGRPAIPDSMPRTRDQAALRQYALGRALERQGNPVGAIVAYRNAVGLRPDLPDAHYRMGRLYSARAQHAVAAKEYAAELAHHGDNHDAQRWLGLEQAQLGDSAEAIGRLEGLVRADSSDEASWAALGFAYATTGRVDDGERALRRALVLDAKDADAWRDLGVVLARRGRFDDAREADRKAATLKPGDGTALLNLARLEWTQHRLDAALGAYREACGRDSNLVLAWQGQVSVLTEMKRTREAGEVYRRWLARTPGDLELRREVVRYFDRLGRHDLAVEIAREGTEVTPRSGEARLLLAVALHGAGSDRAALAEMRRAQASFRLPQMQAGVDTLVAQLRAAAPDSLRALFAADSSARAAAMAVARAGTARRDSVGVRRDSTGARPKR